MKQQSDESQAGKNKNDGRGSISVTGGIRGKGIAVGHNAQASYEENNLASPGEEQDISKLIKELIAELNQVPAEHETDAEAVKNMANNLENSVKSSASGSILNIQSEGLKQAALALKEVTPTVLTIATQIALHIAGLKG